ncbi:hypothetical protein DINM_002961 [Dirofilaria immitis]|nr:hypothetical protein [Dirofilaria immitis]
MPGAQYYDGKKLNIPISKEAGIELFERWTHQGISSIMSFYHIQKLLDDGKQKTPNALNHSELHHIDATPDAEAKQNSKNDMMYLRWKKILHDIECIKRQQEKNEQLRNQFPLNQYFGNVKPELKANEKYLLKKLGISDHVVQGLGKNNMTTKRLWKSLNSFDEQLNLRWFSVVPTVLSWKIRRLDLVHRINILSPSLLSIHDKGEGLEALTSIPKLMKTAGNRDYEEWLNFIIEASGTTDAIDKLKVQEKQELDWIPPAYKSMPRGIDGQPLYFTKENVTEIDPELARKMELFENLTHSLTSEQRCYTSNDENSNISGFAIIIENGIKCSLMKTTNNKQIRIDTAGGVQYNWILDDDPETANDVLWPTITFKR